MRVLYKSPLEVLGVLGVHDILTFVNIGEVATYIAMPRHDTNPELYYRINYGDYKRWDYEAIPINPGVRIDMWGNNKTFSDPGYFNIFDIPAGNLKAKVKVSGKLMALTENLTLGCFAYLFENCTALYDVRELEFPPVVSDYCYAWMFEECDSLRWGPDLKAPKLGNLCYWSMFSHCEALETLTVRFTEWEVRGRPATNNWLNFAAQLAIPTFYCPPGLDTSIRDRSHIPERWEINYIDDQL